MVRACPPDVGWPSPSELDDVVTLTLLTPVSGGVATGLLPDDMRNDAERARELGSEVGGRLGEGGRTPRAEAREKTEAPESRRIWVSDKDDLAVDVGSDDAGQREAKSV